MTTTETDRLLDGLEKSTAMMQRIVLENESLRQAILGLQEIARGQQIEIAGLKVILESHQKLLAALVGTGGPVGGPAVH